MFESKLILKLLPFSLTNTVREKRRQFQNELTLKHSEVILDLPWLLVRIDDILIMIRGSKTVSGDKNRL